MIRTGSIGLDIALGGGWRPGTMNEIWGDSGSGKTVLALHTVESVTRAGKHTVWIDTVDGVAHMDSAPRVIVARPRNAEQAFTVACLACREYEVGLVVIDSSERLVRQRELDGDPAFVPHPQREYKTELSALKKQCETYGTTALFVGQPRDKERQPVRGTGISEKVAYRVHLHPDVVHQDGSREIQATVKDVPGKTVKHDAARFTIRPGQGIDQALELVETGIHYGVIKKLGSWVVWESLRVQGVRTAASAIQYSIPERSRRLEDEIRAIAGIA